MTTLTRHATIGANGRFADLESACEWYAQFNMTLVSHVGGCAEFAANVIETRAECFDGRTFHECFTANMQLPTPTNKAANKRGGEAKAKRHYKQETCRACGGERDLGMKRALCRLCYRKQKNAQYHAKKAVAVVE